MTVRGEAPLAFGTTTITGYIALETEEADFSADHLIIEDGQGDAKTDISGIAPRGSAKLTVIPKTGTTKPALGALFTIGAFGSFAGLKIVVDKLVDKGTPKQPHRWDIEGHFNVVTDAASV